MRYGINTSVIEIGQVEGEQFDVFKTKQSIVSSLSPAPSPSLATAHSPDSAIASAGAAASPARSQSSRSSVGSNKYTLDDAKLIRHHSLEKLLFSKAIVHLLKSDEDNKTVVVDIFARTLVGAFKFISEDNHFETHSVLLYKNPISQSGKHDILVIDPNNFSYSSHLLGKDILPVHPLLGSINVYHSSTIQIYKAEGSTGSKPEQYRDCIDVAIKLAFGLNKLPPESQDIDIKKITDLDVVKAISNVQRVDKAFVVDQVVFRAKQTSDMAIVKVLQTIEQTIAHTLNTLKTFAAEKHITALTQYEILLHNNDSISLLSALVKYNGITGSTVSEGLENEQVALIANLAPFVEYNAVVGD